MVQWVRWNISLNSCDSRICMNINALNISSASSSFAVQCDLVFVVWEMFSNDNAVQQTCFPKLNFLRSDQNGNNGVQFYGFNINLLMHVCIIHKKCNENNYGLACAFRWCVGWELETLWLHCNVRKKIKLDYFNFSVKIFALNNGKICISCEYNSFVDKERLANQTKTNNRFLLGLEKWRKKYDTKM